DTNFKANHNWVGRLYNECKDGFVSAKLLQKSEMRKDIVIELSYKGFG
ncbi:hypothetical protein HMPREF0653_02413, partial [Prevotella disiens JCM 6334 = ATCC 29426]